MATLLDSQDLALLPASVQHLVSIIGLTATLKLVELRGGGFLVTPKKANFVTHWLVAHIGSRAVQCLAQQYDGEQIEIPRCHRTICALERCEREAAIKADIAAGLKKGDIARKYRMTHRGLNMLLQRIEQARPAVNLDLFADLLG